MFDIGIGFTELFLLAVVVIIVVGPEELPALLRTVGRYVGQVKRVADDFRAQVDEAIKETEIDKIKDEITDEIDGITEDLDEDPFGEEGLIDFEEHNRKILEDEQKTSENEESAAQKAMREGGIGELDKRPEVAPAKAASGENVLADGERAGGEKAGVETVSARKSG